MQILRRLTLVAFASLLLLAACSGWLNNRHVPPPAPEQLERARESGIQWLIRNADSNLRIDKAVLWQMIQRAAEISGDPRLQTLFARYRQSVLDDRRDSYWHPLFFPGTWVPVRSEDIGQLPDYNQHFIYAVTCDTELGKLPVIAVQNSADFCDRHPLRPACVTHQLMGLELMKRSGCADSDALAPTVEALQERIRNQLTWDPRLVDVYMQRVLMLVDSGSVNRVKPIWLDRILNAQQPDGGWSPFMPLLSIGGDRYIGIRRLPDIGTPESDFHMTAQGVLLFTLLTCSSTPLQSTPP